MYILRVFLHITSCFYLVVLLAVMSFLLYIETIPYYQALIPSLLMLLPVLLFRKWIKLNYYLILGATLITLLFILRIYLDLWLPL